jgi:hypothetical protein
VARRASVFWFAALALAGCNRELVSDAGMGADLGGIDLVSAPNDFAVDDDMATDPCSDGVIDGQETDVDCGGPKCAPCTDTRMCKLDRDCQSTLCDGMVCIPKEIDFAAAREYLMPGPVEGVAIADFSGDGVQDLAVSAGGHLQLWRGLGGGRLVLANEVVLTNPHAIATGDLDNDGHSDLVVIVADKNVNPGRLVPVLFNGKGGFQILFGMSQPCDNADAPVVLADFDGNGSLDAACPPANGGDPLILYGDGKGGFGNGVPLPVANLVSGEAAGDLNGDGKVDLAVIANGQLHLFLSKGGQGFAPEVVYGDTNQNSVTIADMSGDGKLDVATGSRSKPEWTFFPGKGDGTLLAPLSYGTTLYDNTAVGAGDFDGDGKVDLFASPGPSDLFLSRGKGMFADPLSIASSGFQGDSGHAGVVVGDLDGDQLSDVAMFGFGLDSVRIYLGRANTGVFAATPLPGGQSGRGGVLVDLNGDGKLDYAHSSYFDQEVLVYLGNGKGGFAAGVPHTIADPLGTIVSADFDGDGHRDLAVVDDIHGVELLPGDGKGGFAAPVRTDVAPPDGIAAADFDGDGKADLVGCNSNDTRGPFMAGGPTLGMPVMIDTGCAQPKSVVAGDFDGDGKQDAVFGDSALNGVAFVRGLGDGTFAAPKAFSLGQNNRVLALAAGDIDGDGKRDLLAAIAQNPNGANALYYLRGDGTGGFAAPVTYPTAVSPTSITLADFDADKRIDVAVGHANGAVLVYANLGKGKLAAPVGFAAGSNSAQISAGDLDGDGKAEVISDDEIGATLLLNLTK